MATAGRRPVHGPGGARRGLAAARAGGSRRGRRGAPPPEALEPVEVGPIDGIVPADDPGPVVDKLVYNRGLSRLFVDSASVEAHARLLPTGAFYGVTTNPLLLERDGQVGEPRLAALLFPRVRELPSASAPSNRSAPSRT